MLITSLKSMALFANINWIVPPQKQYSPDFVPSIFYQFGPMKDRHFQNNTVIAAMSHIRWNKFLMLGYECSLSTLGENADEMIVTKGENSVLPAFLVDLAEINRV